MSKLVAKMKERQVHFYNTSNIESIYTGFAKDLQDMNKLFCVVLKHLGY